MKCSVKGHEPIGWCCEYCGYYNPVEKCDLQFQEIAENTPILGYCLGCGQNKIKLDWINLKTQKGFCHVCLIKSINNKR